MGRETMFDALSKPFATSVARSIFVMEVGPVPGSTTVDGAPAEFVPSAELLTGLLQASATTLNATMHVMVASRKPDMIRIGGSLCQAMEP